MTRAICHFDNAYWLPDVAIPAIGSDEHAEQHRVSRLRRAAGSDRGREHPRHDRAALGRIRSTSAASTSTRAGAGERNVTPYGQVVDDNIVASVAELAATVRYRERRAEIAAWNAKSAVLEARHRADSVKFGISFNRPPQPGRGARPRLRDGSVLVNHGGTEMGQGLQPRSAGCRRPRSACRWPRVR